MMATELAALSGNFGDWDFLNSANGAQTGKEYLMLYFAADTVLTVLTDSQGDVFDDKALTGKTIPGGTVLRPRRGGTFPTITISSGTVVAFYD
jgi:hypothetical protein